MTAASEPSRAELLAADGMLLVLRGGEVFVAVDANGAVTGFSGHVDLGTGIRTALTQIVAEELDVAFERVTMVLGHTGQTPDQGPTLASETIQVAAVPLRLAAATARQALIARAAEWLGAPADALGVDDGAVRARDGNQHVGYGELVAGQRIHLALAQDAMVKSPASYRIVGQDVPRIDLPAKATGAFSYVHDVRVPGMLHGRVVRPPYAGQDSGPFVGHSLLAVDEASVAGVPGLVATVVLGDFVGVVAEREEHAAQAAKQLRIAWRAAPPLPGLNQPETALRTHPSTPRVLLDRGGVEGALAGSATVLERSYVWPYQMHGAIGPSCAVADYRADGLTVWSGTQNPLPLRRDLALLLSLPEDRIEVVRQEAAGCYGRNCADDVTADAALLSRATGRPVRVQLTREQEHAWEPKGAAQVIDVRGGLDAAGGVVAYDFATRFPSNSAPTLALLLTGVIPAVPAIVTMGDRTAVPPYNYPAMRVTVHDMAPIVRASWLRGVAALPNSFAHESWIDECATAAGVDPVEYRLQHLPDQRGAELIQATAAKAGWVPHTAPGSLGGEGALRHGRGMAYAVYVHGPFPGTAAAWSAWVTDVTVNAETGEVAVTRVVAGQDTGMMVNPAGVRQQVHGNVIQSTSRTLLEQVQFDATAVTSKEWGGYPILAFPQVPAVEVLLMPRPDLPPLGAGESASIPSAAAIANAIFDATGVRLRELPFTPERVRAALHPEPAARPGKRRWWGAVAGLMTGAVAIGVAATPWRAAFAPIAQPDPAVFSAATIEHGRLVAAIGACAACHTGAVQLGGGRAIHTPFGRIWSTNISPDPAHGIGAWSYPAFERAMRQGVSRDGHLLYPAHPYPSFAGATDADLQALYAYLMAQPAVPAAAPETRLAFPFRLRPLMAAWNALFVRQGTMQPNAAESAQWQRGAYLVETLGHCSACHSPRNLLQAERGGRAHLAGGQADGWDAPPLNTLSYAPVAWTQQGLYSYLRTGHAAEHGPAAGPMARVVESLGPLTDADVLAMATYLASLARTGGAAASAPEAVLRDGMAARLYAGACASCHEAGIGGALPSLALNSNLHAPRPTNLINAVLLGVEPHAGSLAGAMPGFANSLTDEQIGELAGYLRARFAPDKPAWTGVTQAVREVRTRLVD